MSICCETQPCAYLKALDEQRAEIERLTKQLVKVTGALRFYANEKNYSDDYWKGLWKTAQAALTDD